MSAGKPVALQILGKEYLVSCPDEECNSLMATARYLDSRMQEVRSGGKVIGLDRIAVITALNITHEMLLIKEDLTGLERALDERLDQIEEKLEQALARCQELT